MLKPIPDESRAITVPRFSGGKASLAMTGVGIQTQAPPNPDKNMAIAKMGALGETAARARPPTAIKRPILMMVNMRIRGAAIATARVPTK